MKKLMSLQLNRMQLVLLSLSFLLPTSIIADISADMGVIYLRNDCTSPDSRNCVTTAQAAIDWIWKTRTSVVAVGSPVILDVGEGDFIVKPSSTNLFCDGGSNVLVRGAGREISRLYNDVISTGVNGAAIAIRNCDKVTFQDITIESASTGVWWDGSGSSTWTNVDVRGGSFGWYEFSSIPHGGQHYWFGSVVATLDTAVVFNKQSDFNLSIAYQTRNAQTWFYGGEIRASGSSAHYSGGRTSIHAIRATSNGDIRVFGTAVRALANNKPGDLMGVAFFDQATPLSTVVVSGNGIFHMHGGIINADASKSQHTNASATALYVTGNGTVHAPGTAYIVKTSGEGIASRIITVNPQAVAAPFTWPQSSTPPDIKSINGADVFVEIDCSASGACDDVDPAAQQPHLMIYSENCQISGSPWFNTTRGECRSVSSP